MEILKLASAHIIEKPQRQALNQVSSVAGIKPAMPSAFESRALWVHPS